MIKRICYITLLPLLAAASLQASAHQPLPEPLKLPPGLIQVLPVDPTSSYFGDAVRIVSCPDNEDNPFGTCANLLFGGLAMTDSHLEGLLVIRFSEPVNNIAHFEITHPTNLAGQDSVIKAPQLYEMPVTENFVLDPFSEVSSGDLNLITGEVTNLRYNVLFFNSFYTALAQVNPNLRADVIRFPGVYGTAQATFEQRADGLLDFTFYGSTFLPLGNHIEGDPVRVPLPFCGPLLQCGSIVAPGTSLHPHLRISTKPLEGELCEDDCPDIPENTIQEFTVFTRDSNLNDAFSLVIPQLGGNTIGTSRLQGRVQIQFGPRIGDTVPFAMSLLVPEGLLAEPPESDFSIAGVTPGLLGHDLDMMFPLQTYRVENELAADDPFDLSVGAIDLHTGQVIGDHLYRSFVFNNIILTIIEFNFGQLNPSSFEFRGPAHFEKGPGNQTIFNYTGRVFIRFEGLVFPSPDLERANSYLTLPGSFINPFIRIRAMNVPGSPSVPMSGSGTDLVSTIGQRFSYSYSVSCDPTGQEAAFQYTNQDPVTGGTFTLQTLASVSCLNSPGSTLPEGQYDTIQFTGFGTWSEDANPHLATVQVTTAADSPYVSIQIDGGLTSDANIQPLNAEAPPE